MCYNKYNKGKHQTKYRKGGNSMKIGYIRVSTEEQETARQEKLMKENGIEKLYTEKISGKSASNREQLQNMIDYAREGDTIYIESISRLARSTRDFLKIIDILQEKKIELVSFKESIDTATPQGRFMLTVFSALAELEREQTLQRQKEGIAIAKEQGKYKGRKAIEVNTDDFEKVYTEWKSGTITAKTAMTKLNLKPNTWYRRVKDYENR